MTKEKTKYRIFIESDILKEDVLDYARDEVKGHLELRNLKYKKKVFDKVLDFAWHDLEKTWKYVKMADEIYADSSLMPLIGNSYIGAPVIFNGMCERALKENITGKSVFIMRPLNQIYWNMIDIKLMKKVFKENKLFMYNKEYDFIEIDVRKIKGK